MMDNEKWVWGDEDSNPVGVPVFDAKLAPIIEWPDLQPASGTPAASPEQPTVKPAETRPAATEVPAAAPPSSEAAPPPPVEAPPSAPPAEAPKRKKSMPSSVMRAIVLHLEGRIDEAIGEIRIGLQDGE